MVTSTHLLPIVAPGEGVNTARSAHSVATYGLRVVHIVGLQTLVELVRQLYIML